MTDESVFPNLSCESRVLSGVTDFVGGLSKRELFAAMAMQGLTSRLDKEVSYCELVKRDPFEATATKALRLADALIAELAKGKEP